MTFRVLRPAESGQFISKNAQHVKIHEDGILKLSHEIVCSMNNGKLKMPETGAKTILPSRDNPRAADWVFVADALNFCFWSYGDKDKWTVEGNSGYFALESALSRAIKEGHDILNPAFYSTITEAQLSHIMRSDNNTKIPLFDKRIAVLHEVGTKLIEKYESTFVNCIRSANKSAVKLLEIIVEDFPCFRDEALYKGEKVSFYKRAQILVADLWCFYGGKGIGEFSDIDSITMFADYRVPQVLAGFGVLIYSDQLMEKLKEDIILPNGSEEEVEIRGCSIHAIELIKKKIKDILKDNIDDVQILNSSLIDYFLWCYRRKNAKEMESVPFHKTLSIYY